MFKVFGGILRCVGLKAYRLGGILDAQLDDEVVNLKQLKSASISNAPIIHNLGAFTNIDPDNAIKISTTDGDIYLPKLLYP